VNQYVTCSTCGWCLAPKGSPHTGCYADGKWRKWIPKKEIPIPRECESWVGQSQVDAAVKVVDRLVAIDTMDELFDMQREIMAKVPGGDTPEEMAHKITCGLGIIEETIEYLNSIGRKPWRPQPLMPDRQLEELSDILHFYIESVIRSGFSWDQVVERYRSKHAENLERYERVAQGDFSWDKRGEESEL